MVTIRIIERVTREVNLVCDESPMNIKKLIEILKLSKDVEYMVIGDGKVLSEDEDICKYKRVIVTVLAEGG
ncbi:MAG: hypothetical protein DRZ82_10235 [Thermoprotei archaeon]|nr:MAG: hypothetical protein DRZ82_10235 [Thermoprotei archaeon]